MLWWFPLSPTAVSAGRAYRTKPRPYSGTRPRTHRFCGNFHRKRGGDAIWSGYDTKRYQGCYDRRVTCQLFRGRSAGAITEYGEDTLVLGWLRTLHASPGGSPDASHVGAVSETGHRHFLSESSVDRTPGRTPGRHVAPGGRADCSGTWGRCSWDSGLRNPTLTRVRYSRKRRRPPRRRRCPGRPGGEAVTLKEAGGSPTICEPYFAGFGGRQDHPRGASA